MGVNVYTNRWNSLDYKWKLPSMNNIESTIVCNGYSRESIKKYVPFDVVQLIIRFLYDDNFLIDLEMIGWFYQKLKMCRRI